MGYETDNKYMYKCMYFGGIKLESRLLGEISITPDTQMTLPLWQKAKRTKEPLNESGRADWA